MNRRRQSIKIIVLFGILFAFIWTSDIFMEYKDKYLLDKMVSYPVEKELFDDGEETAKEYTIWDRIKIIKNSVAVTRAAAFTDLETEAIEKEELLYTMEEQLITMQSMGMLPELSFSGAMQSFALKETYMPDESYPELAVRVWVIYAEYPDFYLCVYMDSDISAIYDINILHKYGLSELYQSEIFPEEFLDYLYTFSKGEEDPEDVFETIGYYGKYRLYLYPISVNKKTGQENSYQLNYSDSDKPYTVYDGESFQDTLSRVFSLSLITDHDNMASTQYDTILDK
ncbi:MAG: hypothetical protein ACOYBL_03645 [Lachnospiraceae bacterium]|jgi:hypothetical protein